VRRVSITQVLLAVAICAPPAGVAVWSVSRTVSQMSDPCVRWAGDGSHELSASIGPNDAGPNDAGPNDACRSVTMRGESRLRAAAMGALIPGGVLVSAALGIIGVWFSVPRLIFAGAFLMFAETLPVFTIAPLTWIAGLGFLFLARTVHEIEEAA
jgi:hypothetical protein